jgi:hypothetical protein
MMVGMMRSMAALAADESSLVENTALLPINQLLQGHSAEVMGRWPADSEDLIITSPP